MAKYVQGQKQCLTMIMKNAHLVVIKQKFGEILDDCGGET